MKGKNFIHKSRSEEDKELFFGPVEPNEEFIIFDDNLTMDEIGVMVGLFKSKTQARKGGMEGPVPTGFMVGREKNKHPHKNFWILGKE